MDDLILTAGSHQLGPHATFGDLAKALEAKVSTRGPRYVQHSVSETVRRYTALSSGILDDQTVHLDANILRALAKRNVVIQAVILTIINQVAAHFVRPEGPKAVGIKIVQKDTDKALTAVAAREAKRIEGILLQGGVPWKNPDTGEPGCWDGHVEEEADDLQTAVRKLMQDSLILDQAFVVTEGSLDRSNPVLYWKQTDGALIRKVDTRHYLPQIRNGSNGTDDLMGRVKYVQLAPDFNFKVDREYSWEEGLAGYRNPGAELLSFGYGKSEVEMCLSALTGILYTIQANTDWFTKNHVPQGLLTVIGDFKQDQLESLKNMLVGNVGAVGGNIWETPILASKPDPSGKQSQVDWVPFTDKSRMDMVSRTYMELCTALVAAVFQIAPEEFGFHSFGGPQAALNSADPEDVLEHSQHKGLLPKVLWLCRFLSAAIVERINPDFELSIQGLRARYNPEMLQECELETRLQSLGYSLNQVRDQQDEARVYDPLDPDLWRQITDKHDAKFYGTQRERLQAIADDYKAAGGKLGDYPDAPAGNPGMMQIWMQQHLAEQQDTQQQMSGMAQNAAAGQQQDEQQEKQGVQGQMQSLGERQQQRGWDQEDQQSQDAATGDVRIPQRPTAAPGAQLGNFGKSVEGVRVYRVSVRDAA